jgi:hypothetical protein
MERRRTMREMNEHSVGRYLSDRLDCEIEARPGEEPGDTVFVPRRSGCGALSLSEELVSRLDSSALLQRIRKERIDDLLLRGETVILSVVATEILPQAW